MDDKQLQEFRQRAKEIRARAEYLAIMESGKQMEIRRFLSSYPTLEEIKASKYYDSIPASLIESIAKLEAEYKATIDYLNDLLEQVLGNTENLSESSEEES